jgi:hypothetical protein
MSGVLVIDIETFSVVALADTSIKTYAAHAQTAVWCAALLLNDQPAHVWCPGAELPRFLCEAIEDPACAIVAHNANFEINLWNYKLHPVHGWPPTPALERWVCTMAGAQALALPPSLGKCADALQLEYRKGDDALMKRMARPRLPRANEDPAQLYFNDSAEDFARLCDYCVGDTLCEQALFRWLLRHWGQQSNIDGNSLRSATTAA